jgi:hypothetical protein
MQATHSPDDGEGETLFLVWVAALAFGLLKDIDYLLCFSDMTNTRELYVVLLAKMLYHHPRNKHLNSVLP